MTPPPDGPRPQGYGGQQWTNLLFGKGEAVARFQIESRE